MFGKLIATAIVLALAISGEPVRAACPGATSGINLTTGGASAHVTYVNAGTCAQIGPAGVTAVNNASIATVVADATGFVVTPVTAGSFILTLKSSGFADASIGVAVVAGATPTAITNP